jgi:DNA-directed RNA polymerase subunit L
MQVKNIKIRRFTPSEKPERQLKAVAQHVKYYRTHVDTSIPALSELVPQHTQHTVRFELSGATTAFANMIRRTLEDEVEVSCLTFDLEDFTTDDMYVQYNDIRQRLEAVPIRQKLVELLAQDDVEIKMHVVNRSTKRKTLYTRDLTLYNKRTKKNMDTSAYFEQNVVLYGDATFVLSPETRSYLGVHTDLFKYAYGGMKHAALSAMKDVLHESKVALKPGALPAAEPILNELQLTLPPDRIHMIAYRGFDHGLDYGRTVVIKNIKTKQGISLQNANAYSFVSGIYYDILSADTASAASSDSTMTSSPTRFKLGYRTYGNIEPKAVIVKTANTLLQRLATIASELDQAKKLPYFSECMEINTVDKLTIISIKNETMTLANAISRYVYTIEPHILYVAPAIINTDVNKVLIKLNHSEPIKLAKLAVKALRADLAILKKAFK